MSQSHTSFQWAHVYSGRVNALHNELHRRGIWSNSIPLLGEGKGESRTFHHWFAFRPTLINTQDDAVDSGRFCSIRNFTSST
jgi:hypothetical protein